jgi:hypothetical protein
MRVILDGTMAVFAATGAVLLVVLLLYAAAYPE